MKIFTRTALGFSQFQLYNFNVIIFLGKILFMFVLGEGEMLLCGNPLNWHFSVLCIFRSCTQR